MCVDKAHQFVRTQHPLGDVTHVVFVVVARIEKLLHRLGKITLAQGQSSRLTLCAALCAQRFVPVAARNPTLISGKAFNHFCVVRSRLFLIARAHGEFC